MSGVLFNMFSCYFIKEFTDLLNLIGKWIIITKIGYNIIVIKLIDYSN